MPPERRQRLLGRLVPLAQLVRLALLVLREFRVTPARPDRKVMLALSGRPVPLARKALKAFRALLDLPALKVT